MAVDPSSTTKTTPDTLRETVLRRSFPVDTAGPDSHHRWFGDRVLYRRVGNDLYGSATNYSLASPTTRPSPAEDAALDTVIPSPITFFPAGSPPDYIVYEAWPQHLVAPLTRALARHGVLPLYFNPCTMFQYDPSASTPVPDLPTLPDNVTIGPLTLDDVQAVVDAWPYARKGSHGMISGLVKNGNPCVMVKVDGTPAAWGVTRMDAAISMLHTEEGFRRRGLARRVVRDLVRQLQERDIPPVCYIVRGNGGSEGLFTSENFRPVGLVSWVVARGDTPALPIDVSPIRSLPPPADVDASDPTVDPTWTDLLDCINRAYRQDDEFFVDQIRTSMPVLRDMASAGQFWVARHEDKVVGCYYLGITDADGTTRRGTSIDTASDVRHDVPACPGRVVSLQMVTVDPSVKKRRMGTLVLALAEAEAQYLACDSMKVCVVSVKPWLQEVYTKRGFRVVGREDWPTPHELKLPTFFHVMIKPLVAQGLIKEDVVAARGDGDDE